MKKFWIRTVSAIVIVVAVALAMLTAPVVYGALALLVLYFALAEFYSISVNNLFSVQRRLGILCAGFFFILEYMATFNGMDSRLLALALLPLTALCISCIFLPESEKPMMERLPYIFFGLVYIGLPIGLSPVLLCNDGVFDGKLMFSLLILIWASDVGAYCVGSTLGQRQGSHRLAPSISPKKSWWGVVGGVLCCIVSSIVLCRVGWMYIGYLHSAIVAVIVAGTGVCGDLFESLWKRHFSVKDSGNIIPGHGGMLDRIDSAIIAIPAAAVYLFAFNLI